MKTFNRTVLVALSLLMLTACGTPALASAPLLPGDNSYAPQPGDAAMLTGDIRVVSSSISLAESYPPQVMLHLAYFQPTPCYKLRIKESGADAQNQIKVEAYAVTEKDKACTLMALATPLEANVGLGSFPKGHYSVWINGVKAGEFDS